MAVAVRIDKWLWAARFFKTRPLASEAVSGGKVHLNDQRVKPGRQIEQGDCLSIQRGVEHFDIKVLGLNDKRRPAKEATLLYQETDASKARRQEMEENRRLAAAAQPTPTRRPNKHERKHIIRFKQKY